MDFAPLPPGPYGAILADPPWRFRVWSEATDKRNGVAAAHYATRDLEWIAGLPIAETAAPDCVLFLWSCCPLLPEALQIISAWGFEFKTVAFTWAKCNSRGGAYIGLGYWTRANAELCLLATRGHPKRLAKDVPQLILERRREHSRKPDCVRERIQRLVAGPYLELFARSAASGWDAWGNETDKFNPVTAPLVARPENGRLFVEDFA